MLVDAGVGTASDAAIAMELGCDGVLMNTAIAAAQQPVLMAHAMKQAVEAGRSAYLAGRMPKRFIVQYLVLLVRGDFFRQAVMRKAPQITWSERFRLFQTA